MCNRFSDRVNNSLCKRRDRCENAKRDETGFIPLGIFGSAFRYKDRLI